MGKYMCVKDFECEVCHSKGMLQVISEKYARVRHYDKIDPVTRKPKFLYHRQGKRYVETQLRVRNEKSLSEGIQTKIPANGSIDLRLDKEPDPKKQQSSFKSENQGGRSLVWLGHQPPTLTTRVQIPATAPRFSTHQTTTEISRFKFRCHIRVHSKQNLLNHLKAAYPGFYSCN
jgi:hypothetical protein